MAPALFLSFLLKFGGTVSILTGRKGMTIEKSARKKRLQPGNKLRGDVRRREI